MLKRLVFAFLFLFVPASAFAGSFIDGVYVSNVGYQITPPKGWVRYDASVSQSMKGHVPLNLQSKDVVSQFDVVFFQRFSDVDTSKSADDERIDKNKEKLSNNGPVDPPIVDTTEPPEFAPYISVLVLQSTPEKHSSELVKVYQDELVKEMKSASGITDFKVIGSTMQEYDYSDDAYEFIIEYRANKTLYRVEQNMLFSSIGTIVVTCTVDDNEKIDKKWCKNATKSVKKP